MRNMHISRSILRELYVNKRLSSISISKKLGVSRSTVLRYMQNYKIPRRKYEYPKNKFSKNQREEAYIKGLVNGDLYVRKHSKLISVELSTTHPSMIELFYKTFQNYSKVKKYLKYNKITKRYGWRIYTLLHPSFKFMLSKNIPINNKNFYDFLAGFFDCEGCYFIYNNKGYIGLSFIIYNSNIKLLNYIKSKLEKEGFNPKLRKCHIKGRETKEGYYSNSEVWSISMYTIKEILPLIERMPIKHKEKLAKIDIIKSVKTNKWAEISEKVINLRKNIKEEVKEYINPLSINKI